MSPARCWITLSSSPRSIKKLVITQSEIKTAARVQVAFSSMSGACRVPSTCRVAPPEAMPDRPCPWPLCIRMTRMRTAAINAMMATMKENMSTSAFSEKSR